MLGPVPAPKQSGINTKAGDFVCPDDNIID
jgi:hypothetical protein